MTVREHLGYGCYYKEKKGGRFVIKEVCGSRERLITDIKFLTVSSFMDEIAIVTYKKFFFSKVVLGFVTVSGKVILDERFSEIARLNEDVVAIKICDSKENYQWDLWNTDGFKLNKDSYVKCPEIYKNACFKTQCKGEDIFLDSKGIPLPIRKIRSRNGYEEHFIYRKKIGKSSVGRRMS